jgi:hypothetical protein
LLFSWNWKIAGKMPTLPDYSVFNGRSMSASKRSDGLNIHSDTPTIMERWKILGEAV